MTTRLAAIIVIASVLDVAGVSMKGNRRSALEAEGGGDSTRVTLAPYLPAGSTVRQSALPIGSGYRPDRRHSARRDLNLGHPGTPGTGWLAATKGPRPTGPAGAVLTLIGTI